MLRAVRTEIVPDAERPYLMNLGPGITYTIQSLGSESIMLLFLVSEEFKPEGDD
jgi:hypothetical protein